MLWTASIFLYYINDIAQGLTSTVRLFADDTMIYMAIKSDQDAKALQKDLDLLCDWENKWMMEFHPDKCEILSDVTKHRTGRTGAKYRSWLLVKCVWCGAYY